MSQSAHVAWSCWKQRRPKLRARQTAIEEGHLDATPYASMSAMSCPSTPHARCALVGAALGIGMCQDVFTADLVVQSIEAITGFRLRFHTAWNSAVRQTPGYSQTHQPNLIVPPSAFVFSKTPTLQKPNIPFGSVCTGS
jgi:hypothetical protein